MDQGGGIPEADLMRVWQYGYTTISDSAPSTSIGAGNGAEGLGVSFGDVWSDVRWWVNGLVASLCLFPNR